MPDDNVKSLSELIDCVRMLRAHWGVHESKELWFRGESRKHETRLRPQIYRPRKDGSMKPIRELLEIEDQLYKEFRRCGVQLCGHSMNEDDPDWDWYFLMQHHGAPTRLLDWSDGALMALHFALRDKAPDDPEEALVYALEPDRLKELLESLAETKTCQQEWVAYVKRHESYQLREDQWEDAYLPADSEDLKELMIPTPPLLLDFPHITRRVAAQRSRFMVFGSDPCWLAEQLDREDAYIKAITIEPRSIFSIRMELRECGVTESVIFPDLDGLGREMLQLWRDRK